MPLLAIAAVAAGAAVATGVVAVSTIAMIGMATTVVGKITKSKELMQIGAGMGLGAGIASVASSVFGGTSAVAGTAEAATAGIGSAAESVPGIEATAGLGDAAGGIAEAANSATQTSGLLGASDSIAQSAGLTDVASAATGTAAPQGLLTQTLSQPLTVTPSAEFASAANAGYTAPINAVSSPLMALPPPPPGGISQWWSKLSQPMKDRVLQMGGQAVGSMFEGWTAEQKLALEREKANLEKQRYDTSASNANAQPTVRFKPNMPTNYGLLTATKRG